ncbi:MAG: hypothetical protein KAW46_01650 [candidate division Zixibacteria bacterium]|nr:hypothetical protein [candidate division Zixibacteria bacterium]
MIETKVKTGLRYPGPRAEVQSILPLLLDAVEVPLLMNITAGRDRLEDRFV